ncbi:hypothetical protein SmJEL517_g00001 [Synchytrium microbalum]|uniref:Rho-GAP domain-containing protein n=1 Tax=Synchytrium microbalum TaxID=1806994 RepID=A0A507CEF8_9FUNG|nr:uncharacterized protein SmJEL517_g00001 [Synchytrium microbalum]TPX38012.1 hypothetical protein SmJEL517_g00001 [Synchytrium microbalum]
MRPPEFEYGGGISPDSEEDSMSELLQNVINERNSLRAQNDQLWKIIEKQRLMIQQLQQQQQNESGEPKSSFELKDSGALRTIRERKSNSDTRESQRAASERGPVPPIASSQARKSSIDNVANSLSVRPGSTRRTRASSVSSSQERPVVLPPLTGSTSNVRKRSSSDLGTTSRPTSAPGVGRLRGSSNELDELESRGPSRPATSRNSRIAPLLPQPQPPSKRRSSIESPRHKDRPQSSEGLKLSTSEVSQHRRVLSSDSRGDKMVRTQSASSTDTDSPETPMDVARHNRDSSREEQLSTARESAYNSIGRESTQSRTSAKRPHKRSTSEDQGRRRSKREDSESDVPDVPEKEPYMTPSGSRTFPKTIEREPIPPIQPSSQPSTRKQNKRQTSNSSTHSQEEQITLVAKQQASDPVLTESPTKPERLSGDAKAKELGSMDVFARVGVLEALGGFEVAVVGFNLAAAVDGSDTSFVISVIKLSAKPGSKPGGELWRITKSLAELVDFDITLRNLDGAPNFSKLNEKLISSSLLSPLKIDERKMAVELYLKTVIASFTSALCVLEFFSSDVEDRRKRRDSMGPAVHKAGYLFKKGKNFGAWKTRYFVLMDNTLHYSESKDSPKAVSIRLDKCTAISTQSGSSSKLNNTSESDYRHAFTLIEFKDGASIGSINSEDRVNTKTVLCAESDEERDDWVSLISRQISLLRAAESATEKSSEKSSSNSELKRPKTISRKSGETLGKKAAATFSKARFRRMKGVDAEEMAASESDEEINSAPALPQRPQTAKQASAASMDSVNSGSEQQPLKPAASSSLGRGSLGRKLGVSTSTGTLSKLHAVETNNNSEDGLNGRKLDDDSPKRKQGTLGSSSKLIASFLNLKRRPSIAGIFGTSSSHNNSQESLASNTSSSAKSKACFNVSLEEALEAAHRVDKAAELPAVVFRTIEYLNAKGGLTEEGIYRLSGSSAVIQGLKERFDTEGDVDLLGNGEFHDVHAISGLLKLWLRELTTPILTKELQPEFLRVIELADKEERLNELYNLVRMLPRGNRKLLRALIKHLVQVVENASSNKMNPRNIGIVFAPTLGVPAPVFTNMMTDFNSIFGERSDSIDATPSRKHPSASARAEPLDRAMGVTRVGQSIDSMAGTNSIVTGTTGSTDAIDNPEDGGARRRTTNTKRSRRERTIVLNDESAQAITESIDQMARDAHQMPQNPAINVSSHENTPPAERRRTVDPGNRKSSNRHSTILYNGDADPTTLLTQFAANDLPTDGVLHGSQLHQEPASNDAPTNTTNLSNERCGNNSLDRSPRSSQRAFTSDTDVLVEGREDEEQQHTDSRNQEKENEETSPAANGNDDAEMGSRSSFDY